MKRLYRLHLRVALERQQLSNMATRYGLEDPRVLAKSRELDKLIVELQRRRLAG